jgi:predicted PurR-regulated permease PerM
MNEIEKSYKKATITALRIGFIAVLIVLSYAIIKPFILPLAWGIIIAVAIYPMHKKFSALLGGREKLSSIIITLVLLSVLIVPSIFFIDSAASGISNLSRQISSGSFAIPQPTADVANWPVIGKPIYNLWVLAATNFEEFLIKFQPQIVEYAPKLLSSAAGLGGTLLLFVISIIIAGVLLPTSEAAEKAAKSIFTTLVGEYGSEFVGLSAATIRSVVQGVIGVALIQSLLGGIGIWLIGIPAAGLWALIILLLAIMQLPPLLILLPLAIYAFTFADTTPAVIFLIWSILVSMSDAFLKPLFLGRGVDVPMLAVLLGAIGGMILGGIIGLFVGAVVLAISYKVFKAILVENVLEEEELE